MTAPRTVRGRSVLLLDQRHGLLTAVDPVSCPARGPVPAYRHRMVPG